MGRWSSPRVGLRGRIVAITGTKGKSTTTTLTGRMLEAAGTTCWSAATSGWRSARRWTTPTEETIHVVEASSFQLETADTFHPWIAVLLNFSPDHLDRHADIAEYAAAKARIFSNQTSDDWAVLNADDAASQTIAQDARSARMLFAIERQLPEGIVVAGDAIVRRSGAGEQVLVPLSAVKLLGRHLLADVAAAAAVAFLAGVEPSAMTRAVEGFLGLEHALEPVTELAGVRFVNDSKATNIDAALRAIQSFGRGLVVILGGKFRAGFRGSARCAGGTHGRGRCDWRGGAADSRGAGSRRARARRGRHGRRGAHGVRDRVARAHGAAGAGVPSFDMFVNYAERGRVFKREVRRSAENGAKGAVSGREQWAEAREVRGPRRSKQVIMSRHRSDGEELAAGNAGCPGLRGRCSLLTGLMTAQTQAWALGF